MWKEERELGLRKVLPEKTHRTERHFRDNMDAYCSRNFLKFMKMILMDS